MATVRKPRSDAYYNKALMKYKCGLSRAYLLLFYGTQAARWLYCSILTTMLIGSRRAYLPMAYLQACNLLIISAYRLVITPIDLNIDLTYLMLKVSTLILELGLLTHSAGWLNLFYTVGLVSRAVYSLEESTHHSNLNRLVAGLLVGSIVLRCRLMEPGTPLVGPRGYAAWAVLALAMNWFLAVYQQKVIGRDDKLVNHAHRKKTDAVANLLGSAIALLIAVYTDGFDAYFTESLRLYQYTYRRPFMGAIVSAVVPVLGLTLIDTLSDPYYKTYRESVGTHYVDSQVARNRHGKVIHGLWASSLSATARAHLGIHEPRPLTALAAMGVIALDLLEVAIDYLHHDAGAYTVY